jgi:hypothetical protein
MIPKILVRNLAEKQRNIVGSSSKRRAGIEIATLITADNFALVLSGRK